MTLVLFKVWTARSSDNQWHGRSVDVIVVLLTGIAVRQDKIDSYPPQPGLWRPQL